MKVLAGNSSTILQCVKVVPSVWKEQSLEKSNMKPHRNCTGVIDLRERERGGEGNGSSRSKIGGNGDATWDSKRQGHTKKKK